MKILGFKIYSLFYLLLFALNSLAQSNEKVNSPYYLQLFGVVKEINIEQGYLKSHKLDGASVIVVNSENKEVFNGIYDTKKRIVIKLPLSQNFTVIVSKEGYVSKCFTVNTMVPNKKLMIYNFSFEISLFKKIESLPIEIADPVAIVQFFSKENKFDYDYQYTEEVNAELKQKYHEYYITEEFK